MNTTLKRLLALIACALLLATTVIGCNDEENPSDTDTMLSDCTVTVQSEGGLKLANVGVSVYTDVAKTELVDFVRTDDEGVAWMNASIPSGSYAFLTDVPEGYTGDESYPIEQKDIVITLKAELKNEMSAITLGGAMFDFTVTDQNGTEHTLSELLKTKKAVVINLWYTSCVPCKMEFPYLQQAYDEYKDDIALLALSPVDNADAVAQFATDNSLSFPMAACDPAWADQVEGIAYPTTIVVDRYNNVALIHIGSIDNSKTFKNLFAHFTAEDYEQTTFADISTFVADDDDTVGTASNPFVHNGDGSFSVEVEPGQTVYYTLYGADGLKLSVDSSSLKLVCEEKEYTPNKGNISFTIRATESSAPILMNFTNTGNEKATYKVSLTSPEGSANNPITLKVGTITVKLEEGNNRGMHYVYKAAGEGIVTLECKNTVNYTVSIHSEDGNELGQLDKDNKKVSFDVRKNDKIQIVVTAVPEDGRYPATEAKLSASFKKATAPTAAPTTGGSNELNTNGKLVNADAPVEYGGTAAMDFSAEVKAGEIVLFNLYKISGTTLRIADYSAYVIYKDKTYTPDKDGCIYVPVTSDSPSNPIVIQIGNGGKENKTYAVKCSFPEGSMMNPYDAKAGTIKTNIAEGNEQGVYYQCTAEKDWKLTITLKSVTSGVKCDVRVTVTDSSYVPQQYLMSESGEDKTLTIDVYAGDDIEINIVALPDEDFNYPAATVETVLSFS